jgi:hypothetical protein
VFRKHLALAVLAAVLFSGISFGLSHSRTLDSFLVPTQIRSSELW